MLTRDGRHVVQVRPEELTFALGVSGAAASGRTPQSGVGHLGINLDEGDGLQRLSLTDTPMNRGAVAIRKQFDSELFHPIMHRLWALGRMTKDGRAQEFVRSAEDDPDMMEIHQAMIDVAASMTLNKDGNFNAQKFFRRVAARAREIAQAE
jgi:hypothetical protein